MTYANSDRPGDPYPGEPYPGERPAGDRSAADRRPPLDPFLEPELFEGVLPRRVIAFMIDVVVLFVPVVAFTIFVFLFGIVTLGLGWALYWLLGPATVVWALVYYGMTLGGPESATLGMRMVDLEMRTSYGSPSYFVLGAVHAVVFWVSVSALSPLVLLVCFFNHRRRLLHDILLGTVVINNEQRARRLRAVGPAL
ncbi:MAG: RDD family protein [Rhodoplanes sp.]|uniref:RDD family protein n=1 Tax=Rhodoplanes sp. TaxID=1968906 RepID=UPI0017EF2A32|nr:RDD family protein [Rhodoplanes sp.]NVO14091.1 RDD family protein [Rhodoplanes sp.]